MANPTYQSGFYAPGRGTAKYPALWDGCVGAWNPGLGNTGLVLRDWSGNQNNGVLTGGPTWGVSDGQQALTLDGSDDYVSFTATTANTVHTVSAWVYNRDAGDAMVVGGGRDVYAIYISGNAAGQYIYYAAAAGTYVSVLHGGMANAWTHLAARRSGTNVQFYKNGVQIGTDQTLTSNPTTSFQYLGREGGGFYLNGLIDDTRVYNRALSANEIRLLAQRPGIAYERAPRKFYLLPTVAAGNPTGILINNLQSIRLGL